MYVVKVGEYYVKAVDILAGYTGEIELSKEIMRNFSKNTAEAIAEKINGEVIEVTEQVTINEDTNNG